MRDTKLMKFLCMFCAVFTVGFFVLFLIVDSLNKLNENNTTEFSAVVKSVQCIDTTEDIYYLISVKEYNSDLLVDSIAAESIDSELIGKLREGDAIFFRIKNMYLKNTDDEPALFVPIVSLKTNDYEIFSLSDYNTNITGPAKQAKFVAIVVCMLFFVSSVCLFKKIKVR